MSSGVPAPAGPPPALRRELSQSGRELAAAALEGPPKAIRQLSAFLGTSIAILATASTASGCFSSSQATILGFSVVQTLQNLLFPGGTNWIDGCVVDGTYKTG